MTETRTATSAVRQTMTSISLVAKPIARITEIALGVGLVKRMVTEMLVKRNMDEMITHFNDVVSAMDISVKDKMTILGMITAIGYEYQRAADAIEELSRAQERWITQERNVLLKSNKAITAERDAAMKRLCEWCWVGFSMENRRAELCEIAAVGLEFLKDDCTSTDCDWELAEEGE